MRGVQVKLLRLYQVPAGAVYLWGLAVGDTGYVTGACYAKRLVSVRFDCGEIWLRAQDVWIEPATVAEQRRQITAVMIDDAARAAHAYPWPWIDPYWTAPYTWDHGRRYRK